jgi:hypothetical protein
VALHPSLSSYADRQKSTYVQTFTVLGMWIARQRFWCYCRDRLAPHAAINVPIRSSGRENPKASQITIC